MSNTYYCEGCRREFTGEPIRKVTDADGKEIKCRCCPECAELLRR